MTRLVPCRECQRHVRVGASCPFCGAEPPAAVEVVRPRANGRFAMLFAGSIVLSACGEQTSQDLAPPPEPEAMTPSAETAPPKADPTDVANGDVEDAPPEEAAEPLEAPEVSPESPEQQGRARADRERRRPARSVPEAAGDAVAAPDDSEDIGAVAAYGGPALRTPEPVPERMVPLYGGPSVEVDDR